MISTDFSSLVQSTSSAHPTRSKFSFCRSESLTILILLLVHLIGPPSSPRSVQQSASSTIIGAFRPIIQLILILLFLSFHLRSPNPPYTHTYTLGSANLQLLYSALQIPKFKWITNTSVFLSLSYCFGFFPTYYSTISISIYLPSTPSHPLRFCTAYTFD